MNALNRDLQVGEIVYYRGKAVRALQGPGMSTSNAIWDDMEVEYVDPEDGEILTINASFITDYLED